MLEALSALAVVVLVSLPFAMLAIAAHLVGVDSRSLIADDHNR